MNRRNANIVVLLTLLGLGAILSYQILRPFLRPIAFAVVIGVGFYPLHARVTAFGRHKNIHALVSTLSVSLIFVIPAVILATAASGDIARLAQSISNRTGVDGGPLEYLIRGHDWILRWLGQYIDVTKSGLEETINALPSRASQLLIGIAGSLVAGLAGFVGEFFVTLLVLFFVFRDGPYAARRLASLLPLEPEQVRRLFARARESIFANLYGILAVAAAQGLLMSAGAAIVRVGSPLLLGTAAAVCSLIPIVGPTLVWVPTAILLFAKHQWWKGLFLLAWGALVVGTADNVIRPLVIANHVKLHPVFIFFALIGGVRQFGFIGLFIGPVVISLIVAVVEMLGEEFNLPSTALVDP